MSHSDRTSQVSHQISLQPFLSDRKVHNQESKVRNSKIRLSNEEVDSIRSSKIINSSQQKQKKPSVFSNIVHLLVPQTHQIKQTCQICQQSYLLNQLKQFGSCKHSFCYSCLQQYTKFKLSSFQLIFCPLQDCMTPIQQNSFIYNNILTEKQKEMNKKIQKEMKILKNPDLKSCKKQTCNGIINFKKQNSPNIGNATNQIKCPDCFLEYCPQCKDQKHDGKCDNQIVKFLQKNRKFRQCKSCKRVIQKSQGCTHMNCLCGYYFCYMCGQKLQNTGIHKCLIPQDLSCLQKIRWDIEHREFFYEGRKFSFHQFLYFINFSSQKPLIVRALFGLLYTATIYPLTIALFIIFVLVFFILFAIILILLFLLMPLIQIRTSQDSCLTKTVGQCLGFWGLLICVILFYPVFVISIMIEAIVSFCTQQQNAQQILIGFSQIGMGFRNVLVMPLIICTDHQE